ncbi:hypothetical protein POTOM_028462 [Populus tomentosa]|uniref:Uncharacterized protein n=1 Tax=Populus tomentosa TaxID=118781 RepID=A0A8X7ZDF0_POPTO|nr:hypothetical protein POTOM_028462 [Populus tomentosa]
MDIDLNVRSKERWGNKENYLDDMLNVPYFGIHGSNFRICLNLLDCSLFAGAGRSPYAAVQPCPAEEWCKMRELVLVGLLTLLEFAQKGKEKDTKIKHERCLCGLPVPSAHLCCDCWKQAYDGGCKAL